MNKWDDDDIIKLFSTLSIQRLMSKNKPWKIFNNAQLDHWFEFRHITDPIIYVIIER